MRSASSTLRPSGKSLIVVELPLRALEGDSFREAVELRNAAAPDKVRVARVAAPSWMRGQFVEEDGRDHYRLTSAGLILVSVL